MVNTTADLVVVGGGPGGMAAALTAARLDASVILLEAGDRVGGNAARSTGYMAFQDFAMQHEQGIEDDADHFLADMEAEIARQEERYGLIFDPELALLYARESAATYGFLTELGFRFNRFIQRPELHTVDRMVDVEDAAMFTELFGPALERAGVDVRLNTRARRLEHAGRRVTGVVTDDGQLIRAERGVVLAAGGYQASPEVRSRYQPRSMASTPFLGTELARGDGHVMGQSVGGDLINMTMIPPLVMVGSALVEDSVAVNRDGHRFHDEGGPYDRRVEVLGNQPDQLAWYVFDDRVAQAKGQLVAEMPEPAVQAPTLPALAAILGCDGDALVKTIDGWNAAVANGHDEAFGRVIFPASGLGIVEAPFHASRMVVGINFPAGGFRVTSDAQVIDVYGDPIPGLHAVGDCVGGISPAIGLGGVKISAALTLGRIAGRVLGAG